MLRRELLWLTSKLLLAGASVGTGLYAFARSLVPDVLYEPSPRSSLGPPDAFADGVTFVNAKRLFVIREGNDFSVVSAVCTHLGCTVNYVPLAKGKPVSLAGKVVEEQWEFSCPCHGSKYYCDGTNYAGPAPKPLPRFYVDVSPVTSELVVDTSQRVDAKYRLKT
jgi:cytochrome b6-f complex iron-sulfur subunit